MASAFITFEGIDGSGKSTQLRLLADYLMARGLPVITTREPGGTPLGARLRSLLLDAETTVDPLAELLLYAADRAQHVRTLVRPALAANKIVLSDRYADATVAYQGAGRGFPSSLIDQVVRLATDGLMPDLTLVFDLSIEEGQRRQARRMRHERGRDRLDQEDHAFYTHVRDAYRQIAHAEPSRVRLVDAGGSIEETHQRVLGVVLPFFKQLGFAVDAY